jgi:iron complex transport system permease protein
VLVGGALALSGAALQALLGNPLADPYLLGVSGGAACGTLVGSLLGLGASAGVRAGIFDALALPFAAFLGALAAVLVVGIGASAGGRLDRGRLLLSGVVVNALASAILLFLLSFGAPGRTQTFVFWMLGSLAGATPGAVLALSVYVALSLALLLPLARAFDALTLGEETAGTLGIRVETTKRTAYVAASLLAAAAVAYAGIIGFVGLLVPHAVRRVTRSHRALLLLSFLGGAVLLVVADVVARSLFAPAEISVGAITALLGAPAFLFLLRARP